MHTVPKTPPQQRKSDLNSEVRFPPLNLSFEVRLTADHHPRAMSTMTVDLNQFFLPALLSSLQSLAEIGRIIIGMQIGPTLLSLANFLPLDRKIGTADIVESLGGDRERKYEDHLPHPTQLRGTHWT